MANSRLYENLKKNIRGQVVVPGDADYVHHRSDVGQYCSLGSDQQLAMPAALIYLSGLIGARSASFTRLA
jgi:hypothetical protein